MDLSRSPDAQLSLSEATALVTGHEPEPIREHWCLVDGVRYPAKQTYHLITGMPRSRFTAHQAIARLRAMGFETSRYVRKTATRNDPVALAEERPADQQSDPGDAFAILSGYLGDRGLTGRIADAEAAFFDADRTRSQDVVDEFDFTEDLLDAALEVRHHVGRLNDVIHAAAIARVLPQVLAPGERVAARPSLGAGNDPSRPYDLETDHRIAEFKLSQWKGADAMRKRGVFKDLVHLALDDSRRRAELYVVGSRPIGFLTGSTASAAWALDRASPTVVRRFQKAFGDPAAISVAEFRAGPAAHVEVIDLTTLLPSLA